MQLDIGRSVTYPLDDSGWFRKLIVLFIIGFVPGLNLIAWSGYALSVARNLGRADDTPLPEWSNWVEITLRGFLSLGATALYMLPVMLGLVALSGDSGLSRIIGTLAVIVYFLSANYLLTIGHLRYAQTDQAYHYTALFRRMDDARRKAGLFGLLYGYQMLVSFLLIMLSVILLFLFLVIVSVIFTNTSTLSIILVPVLTLGIAGYIGIITVGFLASGYVLGSAIQTLNQS
ncbi:MAG: hypothetical protein OHK0023_12810 [Anaerolineae bacterium]